MMVGERDFSTLRALVSDLDAAANDRLADAVALFAAGRNASAIALGIYALEICLKARICHRLDLTALPKAFEIHDLGGLLVLSGLRNRLNDPAHSHVLANWNAIETMSKLLNELRYKPESDPRWSQPVAAQLLDQLRDPPNGVLPWLSRQP